MKWEKLQLALFVSSAILICSLTLVKTSDISDEIPDDFDLDQLESDEALLREIEEESMKIDSRRENELARELAAKIAAEHAIESANTNPHGLPIQVDPCAKIHCSAGKVCQAQGETATCVCIPECPDEEDLRRRVCTNKNETWSSDCEVYRQRCLCDSNDPKCRGKEFKHIHIDYYGECKEMPNCTDDEMNDFPRRMRDWLFNVMRDLAERHELPDYFMTMELEAETNLTRRWANAAVWKWCDLDGYPHDRSVSRHELFPIRAPLMSLEHCIAPFLHSCDVNDDHRITLKEWGKCLELNEDDMMERCGEISDDKTEDNTTSFN